MLQKTQQKTFKFVKSSMVETNFRAPPYPYIILPSEERQTRIYVKYGSHTNVSYHQTLQYLSYNQTSVTVLTNIVEHQLSVNENYRASVVNVTTPENK